MRGREDFPFCYWAIDANITQPMLNLWSLAKKVDKISTKNQKHFSEIIRFFVRQGF